MLNLTGYKYKHNFLIFQIKPGYLLCGRTATLYNWPLRGIKWKVISILPQPRTTLRNFNSLRYQNRTIFHKTICIWTKYTIISTPIQIRRELLKSWEQLTGLQGFEIFDILSVQNSEEHFNRLSESGTFSLKGAFILK